jgi:hypothetical protein
MSSASKHFLESEGITFALNYVGQQLSQMNEETGTDESFGHHMFHRGHDIFGIKEIQEANEALEIISTSDTFFLLTP